MIFNMSLSYVQILKLQTLMSMRVIAPNRFLNWANTFHLSAINHILTLSSKLLMLVIM